MTEESYQFSNIDIAWCPGCGNFAIRRIVSEALSELNLKQDKVVMVSGIGQAAKAPQYLKVNFFNGLHGRALPPATGIKAANPDLNVLVESGDGDMYGEGGNHLLHTIRRNPDITAIVHNNMVYGLTKGQASPTSQRDMTTPVQLQGVTEEPFNPISTAIANDASFVGRASAGDREHAKEIVKEAIRHKGFSLVDIFQVCITFNKLNNYKWFKDHTYRLDSEHDPADRMAAFRRAIEEDPLPLGIFYRNAEKEVFADSAPPYQRSSKPLTEREVDMNTVQKLLSSNCF